MSELAARTVRRSGMAPGRPRWSLAPVLIAVALAAVPLAYVVIGVVQTGFLHFAQLVFRPYVGLLLANTIALATGVTGGSLCLGIAAAWLTERSDLPMPRLWRALLPLPLAVPAFVSSFSWVSLSPHFEGVWGAIFVLSLAEYPLIYLPAAAALRGLDPALEEVAASLGQSPRKIFWRCTLPLLRPVLANGALLIASHMLVEFGALAFMRVQTFTTAIYEEFDLEFNSASGVTLAALLLIFCLLFLAFERRMRNGAGQYARIGSGTRRIAEPIALGRYRWPASLGMAMLIGTGAGVPIVTLGYWLAVGHSQAALADLVDATRTTLYLGVVGAIVTTLLGVALALAARADKGKIAEVAARLPFFIHALPGLVIALALVFFALHYGHFLYQTTALLTLGYATLYVPLVQMAVRTPLEQLPARLEEVARSLGRRPLAVFIDVVLPNISAGIGAGAALVFLQVMKELTATIILLPTGVDTLPIEVWQHARDMEYAAAAPFAILLIVISGLPVYLLMRRKHLPDAEQQML